MANTEGIKEVSKIAKGKVRLKLKQLVAKPTKDRSML